MRVPHVLVPLVIAAGAACGSSSGTMPKLSGTAGTSGGAAGVAGTSGSAGASGSAGSSGSAGTTGATGGGTGTSAGCGTTPPTVGAANVQTINVTDSKGTVAARQFYVLLPTSYDPSTPTRVVFAWHYAGGSASALIAGRGAFYGVQTLLPNAIYVAGQGLLSTAGDATSSGWPNTNGGDIAFAKAMVAWMESNFCVDTTRIMSTGMSYGGIMSDAVGCQMPDVFRAVGVMSGALFGSTSSCKSHPIAAWITHGDADPMVDIAGDETARDRFLADNHCGTTSAAVDPSPCMSYDGCDSGYPVVWCPVAGEGHVIPSFAASGIANFFAQF